MSGRGGYLTRSIALAGAVVLAFSASGAAAGQTEAVRPPASADSAAILEVVTSFHTALRNGDSKTVQELLTEDAIVLEGGKLETRSEYIASHLDEDIAFASAVEHVRKVTVAGIEGSVAWVASTSYATPRTRRYRARESAELMVLVRHSGAWRIRAIHWSSRPLLRD